MIKDIVEYYFSLKSIIPRLVLLMMLPVHDIVKTRTLRTFIDLFYWPDGICLDMIIVYVLLIGCLFVVLMDITRFLKIFNATSK